MLHVLRLLIVIVGSMPVFAGCCSNGGQLSPRSTMALFNGVDLAGWQGLAADPLVWTSMSPAERDTAQAKADERMRQHWSVVVEDGTPVLAFDGLGDSLCTIEHYGDFELSLDWKITSGGDSGIYLRGVPQVQIWDHAIGSGGLFNNQRHASTPRVVADRPVGTWNTFKIRMRGDRVTVWLNDRLVVDDVPLENYWDAGQPIPRRGPIELQAHGTPLWFRNIFVQPLAQAEDVERSAVLHSRRGR